MPKIDIVICNAGVMWLPQCELSEDGVEMQIATNHLGHFLFVNLIMEKLVAALKLPQTVPCGSSMCHL